MVTVKHIYAAYGDRTVLRDVSADFLPGQFTALLGPNGSGKSTLLKVLTGIKKPERGEIIRGENNLPLAQYMAYLPQTRMAHPLMSVRDIIALGRAPHRKPFGRQTSGNDEAIETALHMTDLTALAKMPYGTLSGGQQARVLLARALAVEAPVLLVDEPIASLDPYYQLIILDILKRQAQAGKTVIAALHDLALVEQFADQAMLLCGGQVVANGTAADVLSAKNLENVFHIKKTGGYFRPV